MEKENSAEILVNSSALKMEASDVSYSLAAF